MEFISTNGGVSPSPFGKAALKGLAADAGLFMPAEWPELPDNFWEEIHDKNLPEIGYQISRLFIDELDEGVLREISAEALNFDAPLIKLGDGIYILELFHGPTLAFKDFGARFMSRLFSRLRQEADRDLIILAATSGDTGSAVAQGFLGVEGVKVCLLYPGGKVSHIQEQQLTTAGQNVTALEVEGTFDDCQNMVKEAFSDRALNQKLALTSANSINIARLIPQMFYYVYAVAQLEGKSPAFCVPSGNFGNLTAGLMAQRVGLPAAGFIAATNANDIVPEYLKTGKFEPQSSLSTISNAMDVGNPSNFDRIVHLFEGNKSTIKEHIWGASFSDSQTRDAIQSVYETEGYLMDPHTAVGYNAVQKYRNMAAGYFGEDSSSPFVLLSTAHPAKFADVIEPVIGDQVEIPQRLKECLEQEKQSIPIKNDYSKLKKWLLENFED